DADAAAHADDHAFAEQRFAPTLPMRHQILSHKSNALFRPYERFQGCPFALQPFFAGVVFLIFGELLKLLIQPRLFRLLEFDFRQAAFVVNGYRGAILYRPLNVVDGNVIAEHRAGVAVFLFDGLAGEADERGVGQGVAHVAGEAVDEVILAAVSLVGDDYDVAPFGKQRVAIAFVVGKELLDGGENHAAGGHLQQFTQMGAAFRLHWCLPQKLPIRGESTEKLVVQVVAVGDDDYGGILHRRVADDFAGVEHHREALARALGMPDHTGAAIAEASCVFGRTLFRGKGV